MELSKTTTISSAGGASSSTTGRSEALISAFNKAMEDPNVALPIAAMRVLSDTICTDFEQGSTNTMMDFMKTLRECSDVLKRRGHEMGHGLSVAAGCDIFVKHITKAYQETKESEKGGDDFKKWIDTMGASGRRLADLGEKSRQNIAKIGVSLIRDDMVILLHGYSRVVLGLLELAAKTKHFKTIVLEGRHGTRIGGAGGEKVDAPCDGLRTAKHLSKLGIPVTVVLDSAVGYIMEDVDLVLVGAEAVVENGGIINKIGTNTLGIVANAHSTPLYVACESYKFARIFPLSQKDVPTLASAKRDRARDLKDILKLPGDVKTENPFGDYTPPQYVTYLLTDLGVFTPSAVSDELIRLHQ